MQWHPGQEALGQSKESKAKYSCILLMIISYVISLKHEPYLKYFSNDQNSEVLLQTLATYEN